jgi:hypothetical protein
MLVRMWRMPILVKPLWKAVWRFLKKLELELPYDPVIIRQKNLRLDTVGNLYTDVHLSIIHNSQALEATQMPYN